MLNKISSFWKAIVGPSNKKNSSGVSSVGGVLGCTPTYQLIAHDLEASKSEVFEAAVYYLCTIAGLKADYRSEILKILAGYVKNNPNLIERVLYIEQLVADYGLSSSYAQLEI